MSDGKVADQAAYEQAEARLRSWLLQAAKRYAGVRFDSEDLYQEACLFMWQAISSGQGPNSVADWDMWMRRCLVHDFSDRLRYEKSPVRDVRRTVSGAGTEDSASMFDRLADGVEPGAELVSRETVLRVLRTLSRDERLLLREYLDPGEGTKQLLAQYDKARIWRSRPSVWYYRPPGWSWRRTRNVWSSLKAKIVSFFSREQAAIKYDLPIPK